MLKTYYMYDKDRAQDKYNKHLIGEEHYESPKGDIIDFYIFVDKTSNTVYVQLEINDVVQTFQPVR